MDSSSIIEQQLDFYRRGKAGCLFVAHAAHQPSSFKWSIDTCQTIPAAVESLIDAAIEDGSIATKSLIFPEIDESTSLEPLLVCLAAVPQIQLGQDIEFGGSRCLGLRVLIGPDLSWVSGFGPFRFLPTTRQAPYTEIAFRTKTRPSYSRVMKEAPPSVLHLADMNLNNMTKRKFEHLWEGSLQNTKRILGHSPDLRSAAKTTFAIPIVANAY